MKNILFLISVCLLSTSILAQDKNDNIIVSFYNVENLFDTINDPTINDEAFTPEGSKKWNTEKYNKKINDIAKVIASLKENKLPVLAGFAEIENQLVLEDLIKTDYLKTGHYKIIHEESPDIRGIDVALIYNANKFRYLSHTKIPIPLETEYKVRDILYVKGILLNTDTIHVFVNHWKSRSGGQAETEPQRVQCALVLKNTLDSIRTVNKDAKFIIMGDLNDTPTDKSIFETLKADNSKDESSLYNLMLPLSEKGLGTHSYRGEWNMLDNIIVSNNLMDSSSDLQVKDYEGHIFSADWITFTSKNGSKSPNRTYGGPNYYGGYSDHYPIYMILTKQ